MKCQAHTRYLISGSLFCIQQFKISRTLFSVFVDNNTMGTFKLRYNPCNMKFPFRVHDQWL